MRAAGGLLFALGILSTACGQSGGAASVRWQITDLTTGESYDPRDVSDRVTGFCTHVFHKCEPLGESDRRWTIERVRIRIESIDPADAPGTRAEILALDPNLEFPCNVREGTTPFIIPNGIYAFSVLAIAASADDAHTVGLVPPPIIRTVDGTEIINLDVMEIGVRPLTLSGAPDDCNVVVPVDP